MVLSMKMEKWAPWVKNESLFQMEDCLSSVHNWGKNGGWDSQTQQQVCYVEERVEFKVEITLHSYPHLRTRAVKSKQSLDVRRAQNQDSSPHYSDEQEQTVWSVSKIITWRVFWLDTSACLATKSPCGWTLKGIFLFGGLEIPYKLSKEAR